jgi:hypothetical protein
MSLIVDINPVPWDILELVKARILKNRAKKQGRKPEKPGELRRVMQVDKGLLAKQRKEEPSFILSENVPFIIIDNNALALQGVTAQSTDSYQAKLNNNILGDITFSDNLEACLFIWSSNEEDINEIKDRVQNYTGYNLPYAWHVFVIENNEPLPGDDATLELTITQDSNKSIWFGSFNYGFVGYDRFAGFPSGTSGTNFYLLGSAVYPFRSTVGIKLIFKFKFQTLTS